MILVTVLLLCGLVLGMAGVASNPSPYFAALGLMVTSVVGCAVLTGHGGSFLSLILVLIYLGGMLVVFAYTAALAAEPYPESWGSWPVLGTLLVSLAGVFMASFLFWDDWYWVVWVAAEKLSETTVALMDVQGVALLYSVGGEVLMLVGSVLLLTLFVVLELIRGVGSGALRYI